MPHYCSSTGNYSAGNSLDFAKIFGAKENGTTGNTAGYLSFSTRPNGGNMTEALRINSSGNVGIGGSPNYKLDVQSSNGTTVEYGRNTHHSERYCRSTYGIQSK